MKRAVVIGGGITGLTAAFRLRELAAEREIPLVVTVLEASRRAGGALLTIRRDGFIAEAGADSFITDKPDAIDLARRLGLENELIGTNTENRGAFVVRSGRMVPIPEGFALMAPGRIGPIMRSPIFSPLGKLRIALERFIPARRIGDDESLASFVRRRLGREALDRLVQPLAGGIYVGDPERLSMAASFARFREMERQHGSLYRGVRRSVGPAAATGGVRYGLFASFRTGMGALTQRLEQRLGEGLMHDAAVAAVKRSDESWRLAMETGGEIEADAVICTASAPAAARILATVAPEASRDLAAIEYESSAVVNLAYDERDLTRPIGRFGAVVPAGEHRRIVALSFSSLKFPGRAPAGQFLVRAFVGGAFNRAMLDFDDDRLIAEVRDELRALVGIEAAPRMTAVNRWLGAMPQYHVGHLERVARIERETAGINGFAIAGAALRGVGIPDCIAAGSVAAQTVFAALIESS